ncbi:MAG: hypothetical protein IT372_09450, partial [Polyangiaceae bacterium]|nr:hypothetical protein [Polyangiaceae bacterium]
MPWKLLPPALDLEAASISFAVPPRTPLRRVGVATVTTSDAAGATAVRLTLGPAVLRLLFEPHVVVDLPAPLGDMGLAGIDLDLRTGALSPALWHRPGLGIPLGKDVCAKEARAWMRDLVTSTAMAIHPYDPAEDADLVEALRQVLENLRAAAREVVPLARDVTVTARLSVRESIAVDAGPGGLRIPAGAELSLEIDLEGGPYAVEAAPRLARAVVSCSRVVLRKDGADQAEVRRFVLLRGGELRVEDVHPLGATGQLAGVEGLVRLLGALGARGPLGLDRAHLEPSAVLSLVREEIERALQPALIQWIRDSAGAAP